MIYHLVMDLGFTIVAPDPPDAFDLFTTRVMDELCKLEDADTGIIDADIAASLTQRTLSVQMDIDADSHRDALRLCSSNVRSALHAAGCGTPGWPTIPDELPAPREPDYASA